jgi:predicted adenine nucleotide alpha hydrolase (AANH) superfamily ATPase
LRLLVHCCCAPDATAIARLAGDFAVSTYFYNPNIHPHPEYELRLAEMDKVHQALGIQGIEAPYDPQKWLDFIKGHEMDLEKGERCRKCYAMRLQETARIAREQGFDAFTTVLSASPHKVTQWIMEEGEKAAQQEGIEFIPHDFKQKDGYLETIRRSKELGIYRQDYCGCIYSLWQRQEEERLKKAYQERLKLRFKEQIPAFMLCLYVEQQGSILLVQEGEAFGLPKGYLHPGEKIRQALKRIAAENGFEISAPSAGEVSEVLSGDHRIIQTYGAVFQGAREEFSGKWYHPEQLTTLEILEWDRKHLHIS